jgi:salicylate hydroxylase
MLLQRWNVADVIGENLVRFEELNMRRKDGTRVSHTKIDILEKALNRPWWVVHRAHLHEGLATIAKQQGAQIYIDSRIVNVEFKDGDQVTVTTQKGSDYTFDLVVGADGINSIVRKSLFPDAKPEPPTTNSAYRAIVPYDQIRKDPIAKELSEKLAMDVWMAPNAYIITYPISAGKDLNLVLSHHRPQKLRVTEHDVPIKQLQEEYKDFDPRIKRIVDMIPNTVSEILYPDSCPLGPCTHHLF